MPVMVWTGATEVFVPAKTLSVRLVAAAGPVKFTVAEALPGTTLVMLGVAGGETGTLVNALHSPVTGSVPVQNRRFSMFHSVSTPSPFANRSAAATKALSATVTLPLA